MAVSNARLRSSADGKRCVSMWCPAILYAMGENSTFCTLFYTLFYTLFCTLRTLRWRLPAGNTVLPRLSSKGGPTGHSGQV
jgi:hypothetical protein